MKKSYDPIDPNEPAFAMQDTESRHGARGVNVRTWLAAQAMQALIAAHCMDTMREVVTRAYGYADAMIARADEPTNEDDA